MEFGNLQLSGIVGFEYGLDDNDNFAPSQEGLIKKKPTAPDPYTN